MPVDYRDLTAREIIERVRVWLRDGLSLTEIARELGIDPPGAPMRRVEALRRIVRDSAKRAAMPVPAIGRVPRIGERFDGRRRYRPLFSEVRIAAHDRRRIRRGGPDADPALARRTALVPSAILHWLGARPGSRIQFAFDSRFRIALIIGDGEPEQGPGGIPPLDVGVGEDLVARALGIELPAAGEEATASDP